MYMCIFISLFKIDRHLRGKHTIFLHYKNLRPFAGKAIWNEESLYHVFPRITKHIV